MKNKYLIIVEQSQTGFSAYCPDLPGCVATGSSKQEVENNMKQAIAFHLEGLKEDGKQIPDSTTYSSYLDIEAA